MLKEPQGAPRNLGSPRPNGALIPSSPRPPLSACFESCFARRSQQQRVDGVHCPLLRYLTFPARGPRRTLLALRLHNLGYHGYTARNKGNYERGTNTGDVTRLRRWRVSNDRTMRITSLLKRWSSSEPSKPSPTANHRLQTARQSWGQGLRVDRQEGTRRSKTGPGGGVSPSNFRGQCPSRHVSLSSLPSAVCSSSPNTPTRYCTCKIGGASPFLDWPSSLLAHHCSRPYSPCALYGVRILDT